MPADDAVSLNDGCYAAEVSSWSSAEPGRMTISVHPFVPCTAATAAVVGCYSGAPTAESVGYDTSAGRTLEVTLDDAIQIGLIGSAPADGGGFEEAEAITTGPGLSELLTVLTARYTNEVAPLVDTGAADGDIWRQLAEDDPDSWTTGVAARTPIVWCSPTDQPPASSSTRSPPGTVNTAYCTEESARTGRFLSAVGGFRGS